MSKVSKILSLIGLFAPQILRLTPLAPVADAVAEAMQEAQGVEGASNQQKLDHVVNIAVEAARGINAEAKQTVIDPAMVQATAGSIISSVKQTVNLIHDVHQITSDAAAAQILVPQSVVDEQLAIAAADAQAGAAAVPVTDVAAEPLEDAKASKAGKKAKS